MIDARYVSLHDDAVGHPGRRSRKEGAMRRNIGAAALALLLAAALFAVSGGEAFAQRKKEKGEAAKKTTEERIQKGRQGRDAAADTLEKAGRGKAAGKRPGRERGIREHADSAAGHAGKRYRPKGLTEEQMKGWRGGTPPGWGRGDKAGWGGERMPPGMSGRRGGMAGGADRYPPAAEDWGDREREEFDRRLERARERVRDRVSSVEGADEEDIESAEISVEEAAREGVPIEQVESAVGTAVEHGVTGLEIEQMTRAMAYGAERSVDQEELGSFVDSRIESGERGGDLAVSIYEEVDRMEAKAPPEPAQPKEEKKAPWYKRIFGLD